MSRIHEALKKAEQERASAPASAASAGLAASDPETPVMVEEMPFSIPSGMAAAGAARASEGSPIGGTFNVDGMLSRCAQLEWKPSAANMLIFNGDENAQGTEQFRTLRSRLYHMREKMPLKKLLVTSALPKEGKSFTAANLSQVLMRQHGRRVLLIDADLRAPRLHYVLGTTSRPGLSDYLRGDNDEFSIVQRGQWENFFFIPSGGEIANAAELVANGRMKLLLQRLEPLFDWIVIDSPPAVLVSDSGLLAKACDGVLMVVRSNSTPFDIARKARQEFPEQMLLGVILNGAERENAAYARYYNETYEKK
jgi:protein-tyrosine kinase